MSAFIKGVNARKADGALRAIIMTILVPMGPDAARCCAGIEINKNRMAAATGATDNSHYSVAMCGVRPRRSDKWL